MPPRTAVYFETKDAALQRLFDVAHEKCRRNLTCFGPDPVLVEGGGYEKIWLETQPMGGEMAAKWNLQAAENNIRLFMRYQRADGRLPGSIQRHADGRVEPQFNKIQGFCFPYPALNLYYWLKEDRAYLRDVAQCLEAFDRYLWTYRDSDHDGLLESWCVYDTGEDNALRYGDAPVYWEGEAPPTGHPIVPMASMDFMSYSFACRDTLAHISRLLGNEQEAAWREQADAVARALREKLWDDAAGACFDRDAHGQRMPTLTHNNLRCMYWGSFSPAMADRFVREHLMNPAEFWTPFPLPSVAVNDPLFRNAPENNWSGQPEGLTYQRAILALERYGFEQIVTALGRRLLRAVIDGGYLFPQQFDPFTGHPSRVGMISHRPIAPGSTEPPQDAYGPTLLAVLEYLAHLYGVHMDQGRIWFSLCRADAPYLYEQAWGDHLYRIESTGREAAIFVDSRLLCRVPCGQRLITDAEGNILTRRTLE
ncbi:MAG: hypothetical protein IJ662_13640 [Clostridia bacterium]|nr:hypothetical protein [Clostridia bacterium]